MWNLASIMFLLSRGHCILTFKRPLCSRARASLPDNAKCKQRHVGMVKDAPQQTLGCGD
ncbi:uncharacterized protein LACBIDRAFT_315115 [Laccaria bicolor S238N-H82]|uniref:Predicted protein n=1 Tax=Laccaria bicolor (strain S238N-H82 / ATCC MYA-4686) TaxID=486041 RepID=B0DZV1_LACBS|nr:uncharacterized protein LACBIDRAFT_315115 [Laccaria bicolor S238N-H82]EDQ99936.1 predicted protein [Laccaria bicolor S238N-H82]|eukprot:XP_001889479.1 predicted protein [Laccaria bicolor S238N-H82]